jgi:hypothetical protein
MHPNPKGSNFHPKNAGISGNHSAWLYGVWFYAE